MVIGNKLGIKDSLELARIEEKMTKERAKEIFDENLLLEKTAGSFETLAFIHYHLFQDIYDFAGRIREVNISKGGFRFAPVLYLPQSLASVDQMPQVTFEQIVEKYVEMNVAHPFREGNGRSMRIWLDHILKQQLGQVIDWSQVGKEDYLLAMERSPIRDIEIKYVLKAALTSDVDNVTLYMKGIDHSYAYEGYSLFRTEDL
ncbi:MULTISPECIES: protein adenylyltransferase Fic [unclassified Streptococcus]|uniref:protein adenylyltransferase Fic n=1 Tax=unclassified Streptococcus TaxID=2608887 RepID=UPI001071EE1B|nr:MULTISPECIES: Fic family protein [unclassified Streptococcus]MBF0805774.1 Fic family protein [Streptococcus sp. 19428wA2_WM07]TFU28683.1 cell filamentation protein Fic [Streptococcus sp. WM07]